MDEHEKLDVESLSNSTSQWVLSFPSKNNVEIRLTEERWGHIVTQHPEMEGLQQDVMSTVTDPQKVLQGSDGELLGSRKLKSGKWLVVVYKERDDDGFIITAYSTRRERQLFRRAQLWP